MFGLGRVEVVLQRLGDDHGLGRPPGGLREGAPGLAQVQEDGPHDGDVEGPEVGRHVVDVPLHERGRRAHHAVQVPPGVVIAVDGLLHDAQSFLELVVAFDGKGVDGHIEPGLEGDHLGPHALHVEGQGAGGRPELEHTLAGQLHAAEVGGLVSPQVPDAGQDRAVGELEGVVPDEVREVGTLAPLRQGRLKVRGELAQVVLRRVRGEEGTAGGRSRSRARRAGGPADGVTSPEHGPSL